MDSACNIFRSSPGPDGVFAVFEDDGETGYLYLYRQGAPDGQGILNAVHVYDRAQCPSVDSADVHLGWNAEQTACWVRVGNVYREIVLAGTHAD